MPLNRLSKTLVFDCYHIKPTIASRMTHTSARIIHTPISYENHHPTTLTRRYPSHPPHHTPNKTTNYPRRITPQSPTPNNPPPLNRSNSFATPSLSGPGMWSPAASITIGWASPTA